ncbi:DNA polymerase I [Helicobacter cappadocius]|uniref:DNA polymerase I n=1 Tax=Helicobacter cappadocius TaxID=3063998 RepID=A0AA90T4E2_9HELI|nr:MULTISPECIES: DNA polymerase I [unclassified Helicobacter]MDO7252341.1 DNA polymerase I [Helicobacter sp. faydin-H75]MDP2538208.1 DNA polymerase I [Helicobacter sp. faydin-H76]
MQTLTIIDTFGFFFRSFYALPPLKNAQGFPTSLLLGFANLIMNLHKEGLSDYIVFALEGRGQNKRKEIYPEYKGTRMETPQDLLMQLPIAIKWIEKMGLLNLSFDGYEADDAIASLSHIATRKNLQVRIISHDKDLYQLIDENTYLYNPTSRKDITEKECLTKYGIHPHEFIDYQSLVGDNSDNVPGIKGIGAKTAEKLIKKFGNLDNIYANLEKLQETVSPRIANLIKEHKEMAYLSKKLVTLKTDLIDDFDLQICKMPLTNPLLAIVDELEEYEFIKLVQRLKGMPMTQPAKAFMAKSKGIGGLNAFSESSFSYTSHLLNDENKLFEILDSIPSSTEISYDCETDSIDVQNANMVGFSFCFDRKNGYYVPIAHNYLGVETQISKESAKKAIEKIFSHPLIGHNLKFDLLIAQNNFGIKPQNYIKDSMILAWLFDSVMSVGLDSQMERWFSHKMIAFEAIVSKGANFSSVSLEDATKYAAEDAVASMCLYEKLIEELRSKELDYLIEIAQNLEFPLIKVLVDMETNGIKINVNWFEKLRLELSNKLSIIQNNIHKHIGFDFNLNSPKQLAEVLFGKLGLKGGRQIKGGYSTDERTLEGLLNEHPVISEIMEYREIFKLKNTYIEPLLKLNNDEHKIHTSFLQTGTATGRLSSKSPNLQNIPVRTEAGKQIREGFIISDKKNTFLSVDYSQIELRLLAHFCMDKDLMEAFKTDKDIHMETAIRIFGEENASQKRSIAKSINFGLIYGMGSKKLAQTLKISPKEAKTYIESYFESFPTVKNFLKYQEEQILANGYAQTLLGHRRYFDFANATELMRANYLREGINSIFQGSAADLIKLSMLKIYENFKNTSVKLLIQVHDELIFELPKELAEQTSKEIEAIMNNVYTLNVPLKCGISLGKNWAELK